MSAITFNKKTYSDTASSGSGLVAADMNKIEQAIVDLNSAVTKLQDSVYQTIYLPHYKLRETPNGGFGIYRRK